MPAEWAPHRAVWVAPPHNAETWPGCLEAAQRQFEAFLTKLNRVTPAWDVHAVAKRTDDSWMRDFGPIFVKQHAKPPHDDAHATAAPLALHDFHFDGWGGKYEVRADDDLVPQLIARQYGWPIWIHDWVLEGGAIDVNGQGTVLTTRQCLLEANRNPHMDQAALEAAIHQALGTQHMVYLPGGIAGDDTDGHIDDVARFLNPTTVALVVPAEGHPDHAIGQRNRQALREARDQRGQPFEVIELPAPEPVSFDFPADRFQPGGRAPLPCSYANFLITNGVVFVPTFGQASDEPALRTLDAAMPEHTIVPIRCEWLAVGLGTLHCLTMQQPA